jgi:tetratricopeptide (TPR) repeat protein
MRSRHLDEAIMEYQKGLQSDPNFAPAYSPLGAALEERGRFGEAITAYQKAVQLNPSDLAALNNLAWLLATAPEASLRDGGKALGMARQADLQTGGENMVILHTLAAAYAETGKFPEAVQAAQHALRLAEAQSNGVLTGALQTELKLYQADSPFHSPEKPR